MSVLICKKFLLDSLETNVKTQTVYNLRVIERLAEMAGCYNFINQVMNNTHLKLQGTRIDTW